MHGVISGYYYDSNIVFHGFVRAADGTITSFDVPGSRNTSAFGIDKKGNVVGYYDDSNLVTHGFEAPSPMGRSTRCSR